MSRAEALAERLAEWRAHVAAEVSSWPRLGEQQRHALRGMLDLAADPLDLLAARRRCLSPGVLSESNQLVTVSPQAANLNPTDESPETLPEAVQL